MPTGQRSSSPSALDLRGLMAPVDLDRFMDEHWGHRVLYVPGEADKFAGLMSKKTLLDALPKIPDLQSLRVGGQGADGTHFELGGLTAHQARVLYHLGLTLHVESLQRAHPPLLETLQRLQADLGLFVPLHCAAFLSPVTKGYSTHYDAVTQWIVQIHGTKRWRYSEGVAIPFPRENWFPFDDERSADDWANVSPPEPGEFRDVELSPGDLLYLPAGAWHTAEAVEESLHLCLKFDPIGWVDGLLGQLRNRLLPQAAWRATPVPVPDPRTGDVRPAFRDELVARLSDLADEVASLEVDTLCAEITGSFPPRQEPERKVPLSAGDTLRCAPPQPLTYSLTSHPDGREVFRLSHDGQELRSDGDLVPFVRQLLRRGEFTTHDLQNGHGDGEMPLDAPVAEAVLNRLLTMGVVERAPATVGDNLEARS